MNLLISLNRTAAELLQQIQECKEGTTNFTNPSDKSACENIRENDRHSKAMDQCFRNVDLSQRMRCVTEENLRHGNAANNSTFAREMNAMGNNSLLSKAQATSNNNTELMITQPTGLSSLLPSPGSGLGLPAPNHHFNYKER